MAGTKPLYATIPSLRSTSDSRIPQEPISKLLLRYLTFGRVDPHISVTPHGCSFEGTCTNEPRWMANGK